MLPLSADKYKKVLVVDVADEDEHSSQMLCDELKKRGMGEIEKQISAMDSVKKYLDTPLGIKKIDPAMTTDYHTKDENLTCYNKGCGENGSVFCHANTWAVIAECILKRPENAYKYNHQLLPMIAQEKAGEWRYKAEPYVYASNISARKAISSGLRTYHG